MKQRIVSWLLIAVFCLMCINVPTAAAAQVHTGVISLTMRYEDTPVAGGAVTLYKVANITAEDGAFTYHTTEEFSGINLSGTDIESADFSQSVAQYASANRISGTQLSIGQNGKVEFHNLTHGLYLLVQNEHAPGYTGISPFLVQLFCDETEAQCRVDANPKLEIDPDYSEPTTEPTTAPTSEPTDSTTAPTTTPETTATTPTYNGSKLPQTGMTNWPVPVLAMLGIALFLLGWRISHFEKRDDYEA